MKRTLLVASLLAQLGAAGQALPSHDPPQYGRPYAEVPAGPDAAIYQVNMRGFSAAGTFRAVQARLDSIRALGVNVLYLMPVYPIGKLRAVDSPFAVQDYTAVNPEFGTLADLRALVDAAHARHLAVLLDWVGNHTSFDHAWVQQHPDWYVRDASGQIKNPIPEWKDIAQLDFQQPALRTAMTQALRYWVFAANIDGYRFDYADGPTREFFAGALANLNDIKSHKLLFLAEGSREKYFFQVGFQLDYDFPFIQVMRRDIMGRGRSAQLLDSLNAAEYRGAPSAARMVRYVSNHDLNAWEGTPQELFGGERGAMAAFVVAAYMQGVPMVYNGQEIGYAARVPFMGPRQPIVWTPNPTLTNEYKQLLRLRAGSAALRNGQLASYSSPDVCAFTKTLGGEQVLVLANLRNAPVAYQLPGRLGAASWRNALAGPTPNTRASLTLQPFQYLVLRNQAATNPN